jgi:Ras-related protein Rab-1A
MLLFPSWKPKASLTRRFSLSSQKIRTIEVDGVECKLQIWDTAGQERFRTITSSYYRGAQCILVVYDVTNKDSFDNVKQWLSEIDRYASDNVVRVIAGNRIDDVAMRRVPPDEAKDFADSLNVAHFEVSAKTAENIEFMFQQMARAVVEKIRAGSMRKPPPPDAKR